MSSSGSAPRPTSDRHSRQAQLETEPLLGYAIDTMGSTGQEESDVQHHGSAATELAAESGDAAGMAKRVLRKIDRTIIPLLFVTYMFNFMDKTILSSAAVFGLREDNNLKGQQYSWVSSIFYFGYLAWEYPTTVLIAHLPTAKYLTVNTLFWGTVVAVTAACKNFGGLMTVRFLLGVAEATITPGFMFLTSTWYTRDEMPTRLGMWFAGNSVGGLVASLLAFGLGHISDDVHPWQWMYIILGCLTFLWSIPIFLLLPDSISKARFLNADERRFAADRVVVAGTGSTENTKWKFDQVKECLMDPKSWLILLIELATQIPNGGTGSFSSIVIKSFGFSSLESTLINIPYSVLTASVIAGTGWLAGRYRTLNILLLVAVVLPCVIGSAIIYSRDHVSRGVQLFAYFLLSTGPAAMPLNMSLVQANYRGVTKKMTMTAMLFIAYCAGNIAGPQFFLDSEAPTYQTAFQTIMICYALAITLALCLRFYLQWTNKRRSLAEGLDGSAGAAGVVAGGKLGDVDGRDVGAMVSNVQLRPEDYEDVTDWNTIGFRYRL
ncbi:Major Facilitator Superfamily [Geosmithia morbida]|uniref:Major Facilitator Superfamily n=1 Tax=Geosmithia morbida TaxID=1094350 RepID=A0A9P5D3L9_9HYPO|nr:Major Facilitator Superfamily [Geosmithia morbida]KAF4121925.1 Major Facilitator Superfamily [Geosmithia morbida]